MANWNSETLNSIIQKAIMGLYEQKEAAIRESLIELIQRDLIVIEQTEPVLTQLNGPDGPEFKLMQSIRLVPKEFDYIKKLEAENRELKESLKRIEDAVYKTLHE